MCNSNNNVVNLDSYRESRYNEDTTSQEANLGNEDSKPKVSAYNFQQVMKLNRAAKLKRDEDRKNETQRMANRLKK